MTTVLTRIEKDFFPKEPEPDEDQDGWDCPRCQERCKRDLRGRYCPRRGWYEG